jgi:O-succinylbenzoic acid--CoA ligase
LTYAALAIRLRDQAAALAGCESGVVLAVITRSRWTCALATLAAPLAGITPFPLNPDLPKPLRDSLLARAGVAVAPTDPHAHSPSGTRRSSLRSAAALGRPPLRLEAIQLILATSGSGGEPKGVMLTGANLAAGVRAFLDRFPLRTSDLWLDCLPLFHIGGLAILYRCLAVGASVLVHERFDAERLWRDLQSEGVTHLSLVPAMLGRLLDVAGNRAPPPHLRVVLVGGGPLSIVLVERARAAGWPLWVGYGMTETTAVCAAMPVPASGWREGVVGKPLKGFEVRVGGGEPGSVGVIRLRGPAVMRGYLNPEALPGAGMVDGWLETSDLGRLDEEGCLTVLGRADEVLVSGGELVAPVQVEGLLLRCPGVREVAVAGIRDPYWGDIAAAWVVGDWDLRALDAWCRRRLPAYLRPRRWFRVEALPRTGSGKLDRRRLTALAEGGHTGDP